MQECLAVSLNDDGTVTLRCDADRFFAHAGEIRRLLARHAGGADGPPAPSRRARRARRARPPVLLPDLAGLSRFLRDVPCSRTWRRVLLVAYFLQVHGGLAELDHRQVAACFRRLRGVAVPGSLPALVSQVLCRRRGVLERGGRRGTYRLTARAQDDLARNPRVAAASARLRQGAVGRAG